MCILHSKIFGHMNYMYVISKTMETLKAKDKNSYVLVKC